MVDRESVNLIHADDHLQADDRARTAFRPFVSLINWNRSSDSIFINPPSPYGIYSDHPNTHLTPNGHKNPRSYFVTSLMFRTILFLLASVILYNCSSDTKPVANNDSVLAVDTLTSQPDLTRFEPDANWTNPTETVSQYGPSGIVRDVVIDRDGIIWLAAWDGIVSYDGKQFTNHTLNDGLSHHRVYSVMEDSKGNMWFGTMGAGAYKYDGTRFTNLSTNNGMISNIVFDLFEDSKGNIWFATDSGACRYDGKSFMNITAIDSLHGQVYAISQDKYGVMWFGTADGLFKYKGEHISEVLVEYYSTSYSNVRGLHCDGHGDMWIAAARGLYLAHVYGENSIEVSEVNSKFTGYVNADNSGNLLLTSDGITGLDVDLYLEEKMVDAYKPIVTDKNNLGIFGAREAKDGTIWYGAMDGLHSVRDGKDVSYKKP